jgi:hypothetical protein
MGYTAEAKCRECGEKFEFKQGGGFAFHLVRCDQCGETKDISFEEFGEHHILARERRGKPISEDEYNAAVDLVAGPCKCKGKYTLNAPPRCPKCRSRNISQGRITVCYD